MKVKRIKKEDLVKLKDGGYAVKVNDEGNRDLDVAADNMKRGIEAVNGFDRKYRKLYTYIVRAASKGYIGGDNDAEWIKLGSMFDNVLKSEADIKKAISAVRIAKKSIMG